MHYFNQRHILLSGCRDDQTSADAYIDDAFQGALSSHLIAAIGKSPHATWIEIHAQVLQTLKDKGFGQVPQLSGSEAFLGKRPFR